MPVTIVASRVGCSRSSTRGLREATALAVASGVACSSGPPQYPAPSLPEAMVLRVERVTVEAAHPGTADHWDGPMPGEGGDPGCTLAAFGLGLVSPVVGKGLGLLCDTQERQKERLPENPDLMLRLSASSNTRFETFVESDSLDYVFDYDFVVPTAAIPPEGLRLEVLDADAGRDAETIGLQRLTTGMLTTILSSPTHMADLAEGVVTHLELRVAPYAPMAIPRTQRPASERPQQIGPRPLIAGEVVSLRAEGKYTVGSWFTAEIGPAGYPGGEARSYNFEQEPFKSSPHACGIASVGRNGKLEGVAVATTAAFVVAYAGPLKVGVNDTEPGNNNGWISFEGTARAPSAAEWLGGSPR